MAEYIEREAISEEIRKYYYKNPPNSSYGEGFDRGLDRAQRAILDAPAADVAPVRHGHCPYCDAKTNDFIPINHTVEYSGIEIALNRQGMLRVRVYESGQETFTAQDIVEIKCCPNCGAKMDLRTNDA